jgi:major vault protein
MATDVSKNRNEVTVPLGSYLYIQDGTSGRVKTHVGPTVVTMTGNDSPVIYQKEECGPGRFVACDDLQSSIRSSNVVPEGFYAVLMNPAKTTANAGHPQEGPPSPSPDLGIGHKVVIQGPKMFALWPGQHAKVIRGHTLRSNQYLLARVYNEKEARANWGEATIATTKTDETEGESVVSRAALAMPEDLTVGALFIIRGTDVSFYIPPTGITVVPDESGTYTRDAVSLEQLEYCILVDEDGTKRIPRGPDVIFPHPTEVFVRGGKGEFKYRAIELNEIQGLHIKVTRAYKDNLMMHQEFKEGDEFFLTGKECPIYFPREEHALVRYDGNTKHFGTAVPSGEARYVMKRNTGTIGTIHGPAMLLPNPVDEVIVRRVLSPRECSLWYPGNSEALAYNSTLSELAKKTPTTRAGAVSEGEATRASARMTKSAMGGDSRGGQTAMYSSASSMQSFVSNDSASAAGDEFAKSSSYTAPRTLTLSTKFEGVPRINIFTGFAVMVVNSKGERRVEIGPKTILLEYDETLEILSLSTGKPKTTEFLLETPYLRIMNNKVADIVEVETSDHVITQLKVSYHVNFTGDTTKWWDVQNYVKHACDHNRSALKGAVRQMSIEAFWANPLKILREVVLAPAVSTPAVSTPAVSTPAVSTPAVSTPAVSRQPSVDPPTAAPAVSSPQGYTFEQNGMRITDVELMAMAILDDRIRNLIAQTQSQAVQRVLALSEARSRLLVTTELEEIQIKEMEVKANTEIAGQDLAIEKMVAKLKADLSAIAHDIKVAEETQRLRQEEEKTIDVSFEGNAGRARKGIDDAIREATSRQNLALEALKTEAQTLALKFASIKDGMGEALLALSSNETMTKIAEASSVQRLVGGADAVAVITKMFAGTGLDKAMKLIAERSGRPELSDVPLEIRLPSDPEI